MNRSYIRLLFGEQKAKCHKLYRKIFHFIMYGRNNIVLEKV